jgi:hypothetical protein
MPTRIRTIMHIILLMIVLFAIRILMRIPGSYLANLYGIYATFTALLYAGIFAFYLKRWKRFYPLAAACCLLAWILFVMQPSMSIDVLGPLMIAFAAYVFEKKAGDTIRIASTSFAFAASGYPIIVIAGIALGAVDPWSVEYLTQAAVLLIFGCVLSIVGVALGLELARHLEK